jgi:hypothetical protein
MSMAQSDLGLQPKDFLANLNLGNLNMVLRERFLLPYESLERYGLSYPETIADLCDLSGLTVTQVQGVLTECIGFAKSIGKPVKFSKSAQFNEDQWLLDVRTSFHEESSLVHPDARPWHLGDKLAQIELMKTKSEVFVFSDQEEQSWSAAMALKRYNVNSRIGLMEI